MRGDFYTVSFALVLGFVCSLLLTAVSEFTAPFREANASADRIANILSVLNVPFEPGKDSAGLIELFNEKVAEYEAGGAVFYAYRPDGGSAAAHAVPFSGPGLWGPIKGFLALEPDMKTIRGISIYEQEETPGLGGEISSRQFQAGFRGKSIVGPEGGSGIVIGPGRGELPNGVDAVTGATMTCDMLQQMLNEVINRIEEVRSEQ